ncbi:alternate-type signal peptide domain-containing protein [Kocuria sp. U4B]
MSTAPQNPLSPSGPEAGKNRRAGKAVLAGVVAVGLLAAGGGTFAKWHDSEAVASGKSLSAGHLSLEGTSELTWRDVRNDAPINPDTFHMVPGDVVEFTATTNIKAVGDNLKAALTVDTDDTGVDNKLLDFTVDADVASAHLTETAAGSNVYEITKANNDQTVTVTGTIAWPTTDELDNTGQDMKFDLSGVDLTLVQDLS